MSACCLDLVPLALLPPMVTRLQNLHGITASPPTRRKRRRERSRAAAALRRRGGDDSRTNWKRESMGQIRYGRKGAKAEKSTKIKYI